MKTFFLPLFLILSLSCSMAFGVDEFDREITEGKIEAAMADKLSVDAKQLKAIGLINTVGKFANDRNSSDIDKEDASIAYSGFIARFQVIRSDREALEQKEIMPDRATLQNYSRSLDQLIRDLNEFLK